MGRRQIEPIPSDEPENPRDLEVVEGEHWREIADLLAELGRIAVIDAQWRIARPRRAAIYVRLYELGVTQRRMARAYAVNGRSLTSHAMVNITLHKVGIPGAQKRSRKSKDHQKGET